MYSYQVDIYFQDTHIIGSLLMFRDKEQLHL